ncbi:hypothetical protein K435DRAFT_974785 [Dendrothele bispora CBS 962.96]|uniref:Uncharacterized protein n=1 Tax=Dendrothele bispora (strain CBS 962.96) TaxID=1314807 RepID=A0A4S8KJ83_DENBC|nr:hypothetical protein K435DRAFT_974785 [Dendrothele bispora CBS 962.96]
MGSSVPLPLSRPGTSGGAAFNNSASSAFAPHDGSSTQLVQTTLLPFLVMKKHSLLPTVLTSTTSLCCIFNQLETATTFGFIPTPKDPSRQVFDYSF